MYSVKINLIFTLWLMLISTMGCISKGENPTAGLGADLIFPNSPSQSTPFKADVMALYSPLGFSAVEIGSTSSLTYILANVGTENAIIDSITVNGTQLVNAGDTCTSQTLTPGQTCNLTIRFSPLIQSFGTSNYTVTFHGTTSPSKTINQLFSYSSTPANPDIAITPNIWDFGIIATGANSTKTFLVSNLTSGTATFIAPSLTGAGFSITANTCSGATLTSASAPCSVTVRFAPTYAGAILGQLTLNYTNTSGLNMTKNLSVTGYGDLPQPTLTISPTPLNFGNVATNVSALQYFTVSNNTSAAANIGIVTIAGAGFFLNSNTCNSIVLGAAANCQISIRFAPTVVGASSGSFNVPYSSAQGTAYNANLVLGGTGVAPTVSFVFSGFTTTVSTDTSNLTATGVRLHWSAQTQAAYYVVTQTGGGSGTITFPNIFPTSTNLLNVTNLNPGATYQFKINAFDSNGTSDGNSNWVTVTTPNVAGSTFNGWSDLVATGSVFTDIGLIDNSEGKTGTSRLDRNLSQVAGFDFSTVNTVTGVLTTSMHPFNTGQKVTFRTDGTAPAGLTNSNQYYVIKIDATSLKLAYTAADAANNIPIITSTAGSGNMTLMPMAVVKLGWDLFTFTPNAVATGYNVYRSTLPSSGFSLIGTTAFQSYRDYEVTESNSYFYKVSPVVSGTEINPSVSADSVAKVFVAPQNMSLVHRWIANREMCHNLLDLTWPNNINRTDNYSCAYIWGQGFAPNVLLANKAKWDIGYSFVMDRWQTGCKFITKGALNPSAGSVGDIHYRTDNRSCWIKDATLGWVDEPSNSPTSANRALMKTNYPGYSASNVRQSHAYQTCQTRSVSGLVDGNSNTKLRLYRVEEVVIAKATNGTNVNNKSNAELNLIYNGINLPTNGSCATKKYNNPYDTEFDGIIFPNPSYYSNSGAALMNGTVLTRNCTSRYEISDLMGPTQEWTSNQYYTSASGNGSFTASSLDPANIKMEDFKTDGVMGFSNNYGGGSNGFYVSNSGTPIIPMFGIFTVSVSTSLGSKVVNSDLGPIYSGQTAPWNSFTTALWSNNASGVMNGGQDLSNNFSNRYNFSLNPSDMPYMYPYGSGTTSFRCTGQVSE